MSQKINLLVSVRTTEEARIALDAGVDGIDIKEPNNGSMGRADYEVVKQIVEFVDGKVPVSAALGEYSSEGLVYDKRFLRLNLKYLKWGTSNSKSLIPIYADSVVESYRDRIVPALYADWYRCGATSFEKALKEYAILPCNVFLIDTFYKDGKSLFDCISPTVISNFKKPKSWGNKILALAGSIRWEDMAAVRSIEPDWVAVRGLICEDGDRRRPLDPERLGRLKSELLWKS
jgi:uncharacterized protein (UPF0264 family)